MQTKTQSDHRLGLNTEAPTTIVVTVWLSFIYILNPCLDDREP